MIVQGTVELAEVADTDALEAGAVDVAAGLLARLGEHPVEVEGFGGG